MTHSANDLRKGKMPEWSNGTVSKTVVPFRVPRVRIPVFPLSDESQLILHNTGLLAFIVGNC